MQHKYTFHCHVIEHFSTEILVRAKYLEDIIEHTRTIDISIKLQAYIETNFGFTREIRLFELTLGMFPIHPVNPRDRDAVRITIQAQSLALRNNHTTIVIFLMNQFRWLHDVQIYYLQKRKSRCSDCRMNHRKTE